MILDSAHKLSIVAGQGSTVGRRCVESLTKLLPSADAEPGAKTTQPSLEPRSGAKDINSFGVLPEARVESIELLCQVLTACAASAS